MAMQRVTLGTLAAIAIGGLVASVLGVLMAAQSFNNVASIRAVGVGVYSDIGCTQKVVSLDWGTLAPGESKMQTLYVKNEGSVRIVLSMSVGNWTPSSASGYMDVTWNRQGDILDVGSVVSAVFTLSVSESISGITSFSFEITIVGTEY